MKRSAMWATVPAAILCALSAGGCVFSIGGGTTREIVYTQGPPPPGHAGKHTCGPVKPEEYTVTIDEIDAAGRLNFDPSRAQMLSAIAERRGLTDASQEYLVCTTLCRLDFDPSKTQVLSKLIHNPDFSPRGKSAILRNLNRVDFDPARAQLLQEMHGRGDVPPPGRAVESPVDTAEEHALHADSPATAPAR